MEQIPSVTTADRLCVPLTQEQGARREDARRKMMAIRTYATDERTYIHGDTARSVYDEPSPEQLIDQAKKAYVLYLQTGERAPSALPFSYEEIEAWRPALKRAEQRRIMDE